MNEKMMKRTYDMLVRLINTRILDADELKQRVLLYLDAERITQEMADDLFLLIDEVYNA
mgnify:FL=1